MWASTTSTTTTLYPHDQNSSGSTSTEIIIYRRDPYLDAFEHPLLADQRLLDQDRALWHMAMDANKVHYEAIGESRRLARDVRWYRTRPPATAEYRRPWRRVLAPKGFVVCVASGPRSRSQVRRGRRKLVQWKLERAYGAA